MERTRLEDWAVAILTNVHLLVIAVGCSLGAMMFAVLGLVLGLHLLTFVAMPIGLGLGVGLVLALRKYRRLASMEAERLMLSYLRKAGLGGFALGPALKGADLPESAVRSACLAVYEKCVGQVLSDLTVTEQERHALDALREKLQLAAAEAKRVEDRRKRAVYSRELDARLADGEIDGGEAVELRRIRGTLGLSDVDALEATSSTVHEAYRSLFRRFAADGDLSDSELERLQRFVDATGLTTEEWAKITEKDSLDLYRRTVAMVCQDGEVTDGEILKLSTLEKLLHLSERDIRPIEREVERVMELGQIRAGKLPIVREHDLLLKATELCHWLTACTYRSGTARRATALDGRVAVTSGRVIFMSPQRSEDFRIRKIINIGATSDAVILQLTGGRGQRVCIVPDPERLAAILYALVRRRNFLVAERMDASRSRYIPDHVKVDVWQRDGGACARCSATEYLEFDHIIPFSKGGSNTAKNIQLLCRRCNLEKGAELA